MKRSLLAALFVIFVIPVIAGSVGNWEIMVGEEHNIEFTAGHYPDYYDLTIVPEGVVEIVSKKSFGSAITIKVRGVRSGICDVVYTYYYSVGSIQKSHSMSYTIKVWEGRLSLSASPKGGMVRSGTKVFLTPTFKGQDIYGCKIYYRFGDAFNWNWNDYTSDGVTIDRDCTLEAYVNDYLFYRGSYYIEEVYTVASGSGTLSDPYNVGGAKEEAAQLGDNSFTRENRYVKGIVASVSYPFNSENGHASFTISNDGETGNELNIRGSNYLENKRWEAGNPPIKVGDEVIVCGLLTNRKGELGMFDGQNYVYSHNGVMKLSGNSTASEVLYGGMDGVSYRVKGKIKSISNEKYGNWYLEDETNELFIYGTTKSGDSSMYPLEYWGLEVGDILTIEGKRVSYNGNVRLSDVEVISITRFVQFSEAGYATFYDSHSVYILPEELSASIVREYKDQKFEYLRTSYIPKGSAVLLEAKDKKTQTFVLESCGKNVSYVGPNLLQGSDRAIMTSGDGYHYKLSYGQTNTKFGDVFSWYWGAENGAPFMIERHKAWLVIPISNDTRSSRISLDGSETEVIPQYRFKVDAPLYDLQGRRIAQPVKKGVYIKGDKKIVWE